MALVKYTGKNVMNVGIPGPKLDNSPNVVGELVRFMPGINEVEDSKLAIIKNHPLFEHRLKIGVFQIMAEKLDKDGKRSVDEMLFNIPSIFDTKLLKKIMDTDGRDKVIRAASDQLEKIKNPAKAKAENDDHFQ